jgi:hypothetical protein
MSKVITLRLSDEEYEKISGAAKIERRPISNFITACTMDEIERSYYVDPVEMDQISRDETLQEKLAAGHRDAKKMKGRSVG